jgi:serine/threonine-protein kinase
MPATGSGRILAEILRGHQPTPMREHITLLGPSAASPDRSSLSALPPDLLEQVRGRVRLLALLLAAGFAVDPLLALVAWTIAAIARYPIAFGNVSFILADAAVGLASLWFWWVAGRDRVSAGRLHTIGLAYQVVICFVITVSVYWQWYVEHGNLPPVTWVPLVIVLFPLVMPGPPRRMLAAAVMAALTSPVGLYLLQRWGKVQPAVDDYIRAVIGPALAVAFAYLGARVIYRLGREVAAARELGSYRLVERLGRGGMGEVWRAEHRMLARPAAIKLIRPAQGGITPDMQRRFEQEAQAIASLRSPHTVELFDFGVAENGAFYYVMELLDGLDADALVRRFGPVPPARAAYLVSQVCHSLIEAQASGLVHRDIKPANIFVCRYGQDMDFVKVLDFGLVKSLDGRGEGQPGLTAENTVQGTPAFIAPEQALGGVVDGRADLYATGCVAYWLLTGQHVFTADTPMGVVLHHVHTAPTAPSVRADQPIPPALDSLILSCLAKDPSARPQTARELARLLTEVTDANRWTDESARLWWEQYRVDPSSS